MSMLHFVHILTTHSSKLAKTTKMGTICRINSKVSYSFFNILFAANRPQQYESFCRLISQNLINWGISKLHTLKNQLIIIVFLYLWYFPNEFALSNFCFNKYSLFILFTNYLFNDIFMIFDIQIIMKMIKYDKRGQIILKLYIIYFHRFF